MDESVAGTLMQAAAALRLIGVRSALTGIRAEFAQALVKRGIDLHGVATHSTLQRGIAHALQLAGTPQRR